jgi:membrane-bound lytic murein transglycosylase B
LATLVSLSTPNAPTQTWLGFNNYYVITRYNRSAAYAMSVIELGKAVRDARESANPLQ